MNIKKRGRLGVGLAIFLPLVASILFLIAITLTSPSTLAINPDALGCYTFPSNTGLFCAEDTTFAAAQQDCTDHQVDGCNDIANFFTPDQRCANTPSCQEILCNVNCEFQPEALCAAQGRELTKTLRTPIAGEQVQANNEAAQCGLGCCFIDNPRNANQPSCQMTSTKFRCDATSLQVWGSSEYAHFQSGLTQEQCNARCGVQASTPPPPIAQNPAAQGTGVISGHVTTTPGGTPLPRATVFLQGPSQASIQTDASGAFSFPNLPAGSYTLTATNLRFIQAQQQVILAEAQNIDNIILELTPETTQGVRGTTRTQDPITSITSTAYGADIFIDNTFRGKSLYPDATFNIRLTEGEHTLIARYQDFEFQSQPFTIAVGQSVPIDTILTKKVGECSENGPTPQKDVEIFNAHAIPGKKAVKLDWVKPCQQVIGYTLSRINPDRTSTILSTLDTSATTYTDEDHVLEWETPYTYTIITNYATRQSQNPRSVPITLGDKRCEDKYDSVAGWALFCANNDPATPENEREIVYTCSDDNRIQKNDCSLLNDAQTADLYFCAREGQRGAGCRQEGQCLVSGDLFGLYYTRDSCYGVANPQEQTPPNFCFFDNRYKKQNNPSNTNDIHNSIINSCQSCTKINSCFDYQTKDACQINNCFGTACNWVDAASYTQPLLDYANLNIPGAVTPETGAGYCVEENYDKNDKCDLCGPTSSSTLFENYFCTPEVCSALGNCFSNPSLNAPALTSCASCGDKPTAAANCYTYQSQLECNGGQDTKRADNHELLFSKDQCNWNRCTWLGTADSGQCVKDGDGDAQADCDDPALTLGERGACKLDITPPTTIILPTPGQANPINLEVQQVITLSGSHHNLTLQAQDTQNFLGALYVCLTPLQENIEPTCTNFDDFKELPFTKRSQEETLDIDLLALLDQQTLPNTQSYKLLYFSKDRFKNQENVQEQFLFMDITKPHFLLKHELQNSSVASPSPQSSSSTQNTLAIHLEEISEPISCSFLLTPLLPQGPTQTTTTSVREADIQTHFDNLDALRYNLTAACDDQQHNQFNQSEEIVVDSQSHIDIIAPKGLVNTHLLDFTVHTQQPAFCQLHFVTFNNGIPQFSYLTDFIPSPDALSHTAISVDISTQFPQRYAEITNYLVSCKDQLSGVEYQEAFSFILDKIAPATTVFVGEDGHEEEINQHDWERFYVASASIRLACGTQDHGYPCESFHLCTSNIGDASCRGADPNNAQIYKPVTTSTTIDHSVNVCYFSSDQVHNSPPIIDCGTINIDGFGITLIQPSPFTFQSDTIGVSDQPSFDVKWSTRVPSTQCRFDFTPDFEYNNTPPLRILEPSQANTFTFNNFPTAAGTAAYPENGGSYDIFVRCEDEQGRVSPEKKIILDFDPTPPSITQALAVPNPLIEGAHATLFVSTNDKTLCKFDDREQSTTFQTMRFAFPGSTDDQRILDTQHNVSYPIRFLGLTATIPLTTICENGAGLLSAPQLVSLIVDYTQLGNILRIFPAGDILAVTNLLAEVETSKNALCSYRQDVEFIPFADTNNKKIHTQPFERLSEGQFQFPLRCTMAGNRIVDDLLSFTIDRTAPVISNITDGNITCGQPDVSIQVTTPEQNLTTYTYELYDIGQALSAPNSTNTTNISSPTTNNASSSTLTPPRTTASTTTSTPSTPQFPQTHILITNLTIPAQSPFTIPTLNLSDYHRYTVRISTTDIANNVGIGVESNGFIVTPADYSTCLSDTTPPTIIPIVNTTQCNGVSVALQCPGEDCRNFTYGVSPSSNCIANLSYNGQNLLFAKSGYLCYHAQDYSNNALDSSRQITVLDADADGRMDNAQCDVCTQTPGGQVVDMNGCGNTQITPDQQNYDEDKDQLPDAWEKRFNSQQCPLDPQQQDTNTNGISDNLEDYDSDGATNYDEYVALTDPCLADEPVINPLDKDPSTDDPQTQTDDTTTNPNAPQPSNTPLIIMLSGLIMMIGSAAFLVYYYKKGGAQSGGRSSSSQNSGSTSKSGSSSSLEPAETGLLGGLKSKLQELRSSTARHAKDHERNSVFDTFSKDSKTIPHLDKFINQKNMTLPKLQQAAQTYAQHKDEIKPGLRKEELNVFNKIEQLATQTKDKKLGQVVTKQQASDLFSKLQKIGKERKK